MLRQAIVLAFNGDKKTQASPVVADDDDEEPIDTTSPEFSQNFKGFTGTPQAQQQQRRMPNRGTQILRG